jgi:hypothetical protein
MMSRLRISAIMLAVLGACGDDDGGGGTGLSDACNPLAGASTVSCLTPFPSSAFLVEDATTRTGYRVDFPDGTLPRNIDGIAVDNAYYNRFDGFSPNGVIVVSFPTGVSEAGLTGHEDLARSITADSSTVIIDMESGELQPHFAELDRNSNDPLDQALLIRLVQRLEPGHRYAVAVRKSVKAADGGDLPVSAAFQAMLDGKSFDHPLMTRIAGGYPEIFAKLEAAGIAKTDLALAWEYRTASDEFEQEDLMTMRDKALADMGDGSTLTFEATEDPSKENAQILKYYKGTYDAPMFLSDGEKDASIIVRGADGLPELQGRHQFRFAAVIPACAMTTRPIPLVIFGHGLFGNAEDYLDGGLLQEVADKYCTAFVAGDFIGLTSRNVATAAIAINDINKGRGITEKLMQAVVNFMALERVAVNAMRTDSRFQINGEEVIDPTRVYYFGASLGGIMGGVYMSYEPAIVRGGLGVPGCNWTLLFERSFAWPALQVALQGAYPGFIKNEEVIALMGFAFDRVDPVTTAGNLVHDPLPGTPAKQIFMYETLGDSLVTNLSSEMLARAMDIPVTGPSLRVPFGLTESSAPVTSGFMILDEHPDPLPGAFNVAPTDDNGTHSGVNERQAILSMMFKFFTDGLLVHGCALEGTPAPCDCATAACDNEVP